MHGHLNIKNLIFSDICSKNTQILNIAKIRPVGGELSHTERQTRQS